MTTRSDQSVADLLCISIHSQLEIINYILLFCIAHFHRQLPGRRLMTSFDSFVILLQAHHHFISVLATYRRFRRD